MRIKRQKRDNRYYIPIYSVITALLVYSPLCRAVLVNRTIDSQFGDSATGFRPVYRSPQPAWDDQTCIGCYIQPDPTRAFDRTWMAATYHPGLHNINFTLEFTGVAIWVFFILSNANKHGTDTTTNTQCNFTLDGIPAPSFSHDPDLSTFDLIYNVTAFSKTGLTNTSHQLVVSVNDYPISTFVNFDWAIYTVDVDPSSLASTTSSLAITTSTTISTITPSPTSPSQGTALSSQKKPPNFGAILGSVFGLLGGGAIGVIITWLLMRRSRRRTSRSLDINSFRYREPIVRTPYNRSPWIADSTPYQFSRGSYLPGDSELPPGASTSYPVHDNGNNEYIPPTQREVDYLAAIRSGAPAAELNR